MTDKQKTSDINAEWIASPEGIEAHRLILLTAGWTNLRRWDREFKGGFGGSVLIEGDLCRYMECPPLTLDLIADAGEKLKVQWKKKTGNTLKLFIEDPTINVMARYAQVIKSPSHNPKVIICRNHHVTCCVEPTELIARATALLAVRDLLDEEGK